MTLLWIYLGSIGFMWLGAVCFLIDIVSYIRKHNLKSIGDGIGTAFTSIVTAFIVSLIPIINIFFGFVYLFSTKTKMEIIKKNFIMKSE